MVVDEREGWVVYEDYPASDAHAHEEDYPAADAHAPLD